MRAVLVFCLVEFDQRIRPPLVEAIQPHSSIEVFHVPLSTRTLEARREPVSFIPSGPEKTL